MIFSAILALTTTAQTIGNAFYIYRSNGQVDGFLRDDVLSMTYSCYDLDSILMDDYVTQEISTYDSLYRIPLAEIDSISFVNPETVYADGVVELSDDLFSYVTSVDGMCLTFSPSIPSKLLPKVGDKLVTVELSDLLPRGFLGKVSDVSSDAVGITVCCDSIPLTDAVKRFYAVYELTGIDGDYYTKPRRAIYQYNDLYVIKYPALKGNFDISALINTRDVYEYSGNASVEFDLRPEIYGNMTITIDDDRFLQRAQAHIVAYMDGEMKLDIAGEAKRDVMQDALSHMTFSNDFPLPLGFSIYTEVGPRLEFGGEFAVGVTLNPWYYHTLDINSTLLPVGDAYIPILNTVNQDLNASAGLAWDHVAGSFEGNACVYGRLGFAWGTHHTAWVGGEAEAGFKGNVKLKLDMAALRTADRNTLFYETVNPLWTADIKRYWGIRFVASAMDDRFQFNHGHDRDWGEPYFQGRLLPQFSDMVAMQVNPDSIDVDVNIDNDCLLPFSVGFSALDESGHIMGEPQYHATRYWSRFWSSRNNPYHVGLHDIEASNVRKVYPTIKVLGYDVLATPYTDKVMRVITKEADSVRAVGATLHGEVENFVREERVESYLEFRYLSEDELKEKAKEGEKPWETLVRCGYDIFVREEDEKLSEVKDGAFKCDVIVHYLEPDKTYYYIACIYRRIPFVYTNNSTYIWLVHHNYGDKVQTFTTRLCPDGNHPHMIDLGLPSGTKWACCNVGASKPEDYGGYYAWGERHTKSIYNFDTYTCYSYYVDAKGQRYKDYADIGSDISGTSYDAATANWGAPWRMPTKEEVYYLSTGSSYTRNGVEGYLLRGANGNAVFVPAAGYRLNGELCGEGSLYYWSSSLNESDTSHAYRSRWGTAYRYEGLPVRPVR